MVRYIFLQKKNTLSYMLDRILFMFLVDLKWDALRDLVPFVQF